MTKEPNFNQKKIFAKNKIKKKLKRIRGFKYRLKIKKEKPRRLKKKLFFGNKIKNPIFLSDRTLYVDNPLTKMYEFLFDYKNEFIKIIKNISTKFKINGNICEQNILNKINDIISQKNKTKMNIILDID